MQKELPCIYKATSRTTGMSYIGQSIEGMSKRMKSHLNDTKSSEAYLTKFHQALRDLTPHDFSWTVLYQVSDNIHGRKLTKLLNEKEIEFINQYDSVNNGYNTTLGGGNYVKNRELNEDITEEERIAIKKANKKAYREKHKKELREKAKIREREKIQFLKENDPEGYEKLRELKRIRNRENRAQRKSRPDYSLLRIARNKKIQEKRDHIKELISQYVKSYNNYKPRSNKKLLLALKCPCTNKFENLPLITADSFYKPYSEKTLTLLGYLLKRKKNRSLLGSGILDKVQDALILIEILEANSKHSQTLDDINTIIKTIQNKRVQEKPSLRAEKKKAAKDKKLLAEMDKEFEKAIENTKASIIIEDMDTLPSLIENPNILKSTCKYPLSEFKILGEMLGEETSQYLLESDLCSVISNVTLLIYILKIAKTHKFTTVRDLAFYINQF